MTGISVSSSEVKRVHNDTTMQKPAKIPKLNGRERENPTREALDMDIILLGPGVMAVMPAYVKKLNQLNI